MLDLRSLEAFAGRQLRKVLAIFDHRAHRFTLRQGEVDPVTRTRALTTWWGSEPTWYPGGTPPRLHNKLTPLVDGESYFGALHDALAAAQDYVYIIGWCLTPDVPLGRSGADQIVETQLLNVLRAIAARATVRVLLWSGTPALLQPTTRTMREAKRLLESEVKGNLQCQLDYTSRFGHSHHQKAIVVDGQVAFVGGMDLTTFHGDRWDTTRHSLRLGPNWHDVQVRVEGEAVVDVEHNFRQRWLAVGGDRNLPHRKPQFDPAWQTPVQIVRTIPRGRYDFAPRGEFGIHHAYTELIRRAKRLIYFENQYLWSHDIMDALLALIDAPRTDPLRIVIVLPARAYDGKWDNDHHVNRLREADRGRGIVSVYSLYSSGVGFGTRAFTYLPTYVHAKVAIIDDEWLMVGSANLNGRGLVTDSEMNVLVRDPDLARTLRIDLWAEHLGLPRDQIGAADLVALVDKEWVRRADQSAEIIQLGNRPLTSAIHLYECGQMPGTQLLELAEAQTFDR